MVYRKLVCFKLFKHFLCFTALYFGLFLLFQNASEHIEEGSTRNVKSPSWRGQMLDVCSFSLCVCQVQPHQTIQEKMKCLHLCIVPRELSSQGACETLFQRTPATTWFISLISVFELRCCSSSFMPVNVFTGSQKCNRTVLCSEGFFSQSFYLPLIKNIPYKTFKNCSVVQEL